MAAVDLGVEGFDAEGQLLQAVRREHLQALAVHDRGIELELPLCARMPREPPVERLEQLVQQRGR